MSFRDAETPADAPARPAVRPGWWPVLVSAFFRCQRAGGQLHATRPGEPVQPPATGQEIDHCQLGPGQPEGPVPEGADPTRGPGHHRAAGPEYPPVPVRPPPQGASGSAEAPGAGPRGDGPGRHAHCRAPPRRGPRSLPGPRQGRGCPGGWTAPAPRRGSRPIPRRAAGPGPADWPRSAARPQTAQGPGRKGGAPGAPGRSPRVRSATPDNGSDGAADAEEDPVRPQRPVPPGSGRTPPRWCPAPAPAEPRPGCDPDSAARTHSL